MAPIIDLAAARAQRHPKPQTNQAAYESAFRELTEGAAKAYEQAAAARLAGDLVGAALLINAAGQALAGAQAIGEEL